MSNPIITREEIIQSLEEAVTPVDFDALIKDGILEKDGAWFKVLDFKRLPKHASIKITTAKQGPKGLRVKFNPVSKRAINLLKKLQS